MPSEPRGRPRHLTLSLVCGGVAVAMVGAAYAAVPFYRAFCQATGFDGATRQATAAPDKAIARTVVVRFDANVNGLPWDFKAEQTAQTVHIGATGLAFFKVTNTSDKAMTGRAIYNVVPETAGPYFQKLECFCFKDQTIPAQTIPALHKAYFTMGILTVISSLTFWGLHNDDGNSVSNRTVEAG